MEGLFRAAGWLDREPYLVTVTGDADFPTVGTLRVRALVRQFVGERVLATPVGPAYTVDPAQPDSILALLASQTELVWVSDGAPDLFGPGPLCPCLDPHEPVLGLMRKAANTHDGRAGAEGRRRAEGDDVGSRPGLTPAARFSKY